MKCPFCGSKNISERKPIQKATQKKQWKRVEVALPRNRFLCADCKRVFRNPA